MANNLIEICRDILEDAYHSRLGMTFSRSISDIAQGRQPVWRTVSDSDLTSELAANSEDAAGLLLDPEIGLLLYILPFHVNTNLHKQIVRALALRSQLTIEKSYSETKTDIRGSWRVAINWLVRVDERVQWSNQIEKVRQETAFSEELSFDAIFLDTDDRAQIKRHGFPHLLITAREVFKKQHLDEISAWRSADHFVKDALVDFRSQFHKVEQQRLAGQILEAVNISSNGPSYSQIETPPAPHRIRKIHVRNFRNLRDVRLDFGVPSVSASVVHGPNGTGKSSLCEAISLALFNSSFRFKTFADTRREKDIKAQDRAREYIEQYLAPLSDPQGIPEIALNDGPLAPPRLSTNGAVKDSAMSGTILTQDTTIEFARISSDELGTRILRGYSELADRVQDLTQSYVIQANEARQRFLRKLGLSAAIVRIDTAYQRIARIEIDRNLPAFPGTLVNWLDRLGDFQKDARTLTSRWYAWGSNESRDNLARNIASRADRPDEILREVSEWLQTFNNLVLSSEEISKSITRVVPPEYEQLDRMSQQIQAWGEWSDKQTDISPLVLPESEKLSTELRQIEVEQLKITERGRDVSAHLDHLTNVEPYLRETWGKLHSSTCPTCGTDHSMQGGILPVVSQLREETEKERERLRKSYSDLKNKASDIQTKLLMIGARECPITLEDQLLIKQSLQWIVPEGQILEDYIRLRPQRDLLLNRIAMLRETATIPAAVAIESEARSTSESIRSKFRQAEETFDGPDNWKPVQARLREILAEIVKSHLPNTLEKLWCELTLNLTSAPWLLPDRPCFGLATRRGQPRASILIRERLARYILNQAEIHTLGLAWFFTSYLTQGRFTNACMIMDDPAHELDQTSFRDLCRLWETIVRLHKVYKRPLKLVIMLNQENRAIDAARATGGILYVLDWARDQQGSIRKINVLGQGFHPPEPTALFERTG